MKKTGLILIFSFITLIAFGQKDTACDVLTLTNGKLIYCKEVSKKRHIVSYRPCNNSLGTHILISADSVLMVNHPDGTYQNISSMHSSGGSKEERGSYIAITGGVGIPCATFRSPGSSNLSQININLSNTAQGYALMGANINLLASFPQKDEQFGYTFSLGYNSNPFDITSYSQYTSIYPWFNVVNYYNGATITSRSAGNYSVYKLMAGFSYPLHSKGITVQFDLLVGGVYCIFPNVRYSYISNLYPDTTIGTLNLNSSSSLSFALQAGLEFSHSFSKTISAMINFDAFYARPRFDINYQNYYTRTGYTSVSTNSVFSETVPIWLINISAGIAYSFGK